MRPSTHQVAGTQRLSAANATDTQTATVPNNTSAILVTAETNPMRLTFGASSDPSSASVAAHVIQKDQQPWHMLVGVGTVIKTCPTTGAGVLQLTYLT